MTDRTGAIVTTAITNPTMPPSRVENSSQTKACEPGAAFCRQPLAGAARKRPA